MRHVIVGNGAAGASAALAIGQIDGILAGSILCGDLRGKRETLSAIQGGRRKAALRQPMEDNEFPA